jgi:predicted ribosome quality control (RQC) complex YloA/Tae2 family protein
MAVIQAIDATTLRAVVGELRQLVLPSRFEKAQQSDPHTVQIALRGLEACDWLELGWQAEAPRLFAIAPPLRQGDGSTLAQQLQHGLRGLALVALEQQGWERVVELGFARRPGESIQRSLVLELMGRHSNLFLLDEQRRVVLTRIEEARAEQNRLLP